MSSGASPEVREHGRATLPIIAIIISFVALAASLYPYWQAYDSSSRNAHDYLSALVSSDHNTILAAYSFAPPVSTASVFTGVVATLNEANAHNRGEVLDGTVKRQKHGQYVVCFPSETVSLFGGNCVTVEQIHFSENNQVDTFSINNVPLASILGAPDSSRQLIGDEMSTFVNYDLSGSVLAPDGGTKVVILQASRIRNENEPPSVTFESVTAQNDAEEDVSVEASSFPTKLGYWERRYSAVAVPASTKWLLVCWAAPNSDDQTADGQEKCAWLTLIP